MTSKNHGNFWALIKFRISVGDTILQDHICTTSRNATYTTPTIQNDIIHILGEHNTWETVTTIVSHCISAMDISGAKCIVGANAELCSWFVHIAVAKKPNSALAPPIDQRN